MADTPALLRIFLVLRGNVLTFSNFNLTGDGFRAVIVSAMSFPIRNACSFVLPRRYLREIVRLKALTF